MTISLQKIAKLADVSHTTVRRALRGDRYVRSDLREKILRLAHEYRYEPNLLTRGLLHRKTHTVSIILPDITSQTLSESLRGAQDAFEQAGYCTIIQNTDESPEKEFECIRQAAMRRVDGMLIAPCRDAVDAGHFAELQTRKIPAVVMRRVMKDIPFDIFVGTDDMDGYKLTHKFIECGHRRIFCIMSNDKDSPSSNRRFEGWRRAMREAGLDPDAMDVGRVWWTDVEGSAEIIEKWLKSPNPPTAIFAASDIQAVGVYRAAYRLNLKVGKDISVAAFFSGGQGGLHQYLTPSLSGIMHSSRQTGQLAAQRLIEIMNREEPVEESPRIVETGSKWIDGESVGRLNGK